MIRTQGKSMQKLGASPGTVVLVKVDYQAISPAIGIVCVIFQMKPYGGARTATVAGLLSSITRKGVWWIPSDQYTLNTAPPKLQTHLQSWK
jgi:hypothetical protein